MNRHFARAFILGAAGLASATTFAATPVTIDTEQKAAASVVSGLYIGFTAPYYYQLTLQRVNLYANRALATANAATTPAALAANRAGITVPCETSGNMTAKLSARLPRVFQFEWHDCHFNSFGYGFSLNGPGEIVLLSDTFAPTKVGAIRFGNSTRDLVETQEIITIDQVNHNTLLRNLAVIGNVPLNYDGTASPGSTVQFAFAIDGYVDETDLLDFPTTGAPQQTYGYRYDFSNVAYAGAASASSDGMHTDSDLHALLGTFTFSARNPPPYNATLESQRYDNFRVRNVVDWTAFTQDQTIDGKVNYTWNPNFGSGCLSGNYQFSTAAPLHNSLNNWEQYSSGDLSINGAVRATFFTAATVPATLPVPSQGELVHLDVKKLGSFNYDDVSAMQAVHGVAHCM